MAWLMCKGYRILGHRVRTPFGEIDIAALKGGVLAIVEVKMRNSLAAGLEAVLPRQQERLANAALAAARRWRMEQTLLRFDVVVVGAGLLPRHVRGAWGRDRPT
jgi:putative endonuclease